MKYFKVITSMGHAGSGKQREGVFTIRAPDSITALMKAKRFPGVKHTKLPSLTKEITEKEYNQLRKESAYIRLERGM